MEYENAVALAFNHNTINDFNAKMMIRDEFKSLKESLIDEIDSIMCMNDRGQNIDIETKELAKKIDELKMNVCNLEKTCNSLYNVMRSFK